jgi:hypothetical protein
MLPTIYPSLFMFSHRSTMARLMVTTLSSIGWRMTSNTRLPNSGNSSKNRTPLCARVRDVAPAHLPGMADGMVRGAERPVADERGAGRELVGHRVDAGYIQGLLDGHLR